MFALSNRTLSGEEQLNDMCLYFFANYNLKEWIF